MNNIKSTDLKISTFDTWAQIEVRSAAEVKTVEVKVDDKAATRQAIIVALRRARCEVRTRSEWKAKESATGLAQDWDYQSIAIHHAGNSFRCAADGVEELRRAEEIDTATFGHLSYHYAIDCQGIIYEALDIRYKGAHIERGNTGVIGIVFLADFSVRGEAMKFGPGVWSVMKQRGIKSGVMEWLGIQNDKIAVGNDDPTEKQLEAIDALVSILSRFFSIKFLGGHREFAKARGTSRACPGTYGMIIAEQLRKKFALSLP
ncbi:MAG: peptidoglycan recognition family protein [Pseudomonadota bacterium]